MSATLVAYLNKELAEHRVVLVALVLATALAGVAAGVTMREGATTLATALGGAAAFVVIACETWPREARHGRLRLVLRLPGGLPHTTITKLTLVAFAVAALAAAGAVAASLAGGATTSTAALTEALRSHGDLATAGEHAAVSASASAAMPTCLEVAALALALSWLGMAVSTWLPRGSLAVPATAFVALAIARPYATARLFEPWLIPPPLDTALLLFAVLPLVTLTIVAASVAGLRFSGGPWRSGWRGGAIALLAMVAFAVWFEARRSAWQTVRPHDPALRITTALVGAGGHRAYLNVRRAGDDVETYAVLLDLQTEAWQQVGDRTSEWKGCASLERSGPPQWYVPGEHPTLVLESFRNGRWVVRYADGATGKLGADQLRLTIPAFALPKVEAAVHATAPLRLRDGRPVSVFHGVEVRAPDGSWRALPWQQGDVPMLPRGGGLLVTRPHDDEGSQDELLVYDPSRGACFSTMREGSPVREGVCRPGRWLVPDRAEKRIVGWRLVDPETGERAPCDALQDGDRICVVLDDGRVVVVTREGGLVLVDPDAATRVAIDGVPDDHRFVTSIADAGSTTWPIRAANGDRWLRLSSDHGRRWWLARLDAAAARLEPTGPPDVDGSWSVVADLGHRGLIVLTERTLERWTPGTTEREVLFPRNEAKP